MATEVDIANLSLAHLGDDATVSSFDPPEGSAQAEHCARFYPIARDGLLEMFDWKFAVTRITGAELTSEATSWQYCYAMPNDCLRVIAVLPPDALDDYSTPTSGANVFGTPELLNGDYQTQDYAVETLEDGTQVIYTNQEEAVIRFVKRVTNSAKFPPLFTTALSYLLASYLAGPVIKGDVGREESKGQYKMFMQVMSSAMTSDAQQQQLRPKHLVAHIQARS